MLVSHRNHFIFLKTGKTAGTSVEMYFEPWCLPPGETSETALRDVSETGAGIVGPRRMKPDRNEKYFSHSHAEPVRGWVGADIWARYFKFTIVRNPFSKVVSWYHFRLTEDEKVRISAGGRPALLAHFHEWLHAGPPLPRDKPYCEIDGEFALDFVIRYETLLEGLRTVCETTGVPFEPERLQRRKSGYRTGFPHWSVYYDEAAAEAVRHHYAWEFDTFGYPLTPAGGAC